MAKESEGIVTYDYNGILLELDASAPDFKDKKMALERNGAVEVKQESFKALGFIVLLKKQSSS